jgi:hypothetical protein
MSIRQRCQPKESGGVKSIQDELLAQGEFEPVPSVAMTFAKRVAAKARVDVEMLITIAPIEESKRVPEQAYSTGIKLKTLYKHFSALMIGSIDDAVVYCRRKGKPLPYADGRVFVPTHGVLAFADIVAAYVYDNVPRQAMSASQGRQAMNQTLNYIAKMTEEARADHSEDDKRRSIAAGLAGPNGDLEF